MLCGRILVVSLLFTVACGGDDAPLVDTAPECNPLGESSSCVMPWPSSIYEATETASPTSIRLDVPVGALPTNVDDAQADPAWLNERDGWSANAPFLMAFSTGVDPANLPPHTDFARSLAADSPTVIVDMETNERVAHFAELDVASVDQPATQALIIRPAARLRPGKRYAIAIRKSLKAAGGGELPISAGFKAILDGTITTHARLERIRPAYDAIFASLEAVSVPRTDLVVAWDITTATDERVQADLLDARDAILAAAGDTAANLTFTVDSDVPGGDPLETLRIIEGTFDMPLVLTEGGSDDGVLARDATGKPMVVGTIQAPFGAVIPACASDPANLPLPVMVYGHGLMGSYGEALGGYVRFAAQNLCVIVVATDWRGMSEVDLTPVALALNNVNAAPLIMEKLVQGVNQFVVLEQLARGPMATSTTFQEGGVPLIDPSRVYYYGISQGGIFGGTFMAIDPFITRGVLGVPAANYTYYIERSTNWDLYGLFILAAYPNDPLGIQVLLTLMQTWWDLSDPSSFVAHLTGDAAPPLRGTPEKQILIQMAVGDAQVSNIGTEWEARVMGIPVLGPAVYTPYGVTEAAGPLPSALTIWDEHKLPLPPLTNEGPASDNETHGTLRKRGAVNEQIKTFFETGEIVNTCLAAGVPVACDCTVEATCGPYVD